MSWWSVCEYRCRCCVAAVTAAVCVCVYHSLLVLQASKQWSKQATKQSPGRDTGRQVRVALYSSHVPRRVRCAARAAAMRMVVCVCVLQLLDLAHLVAYAPPPTPGSHRPTRDATRRDAREKIKEIILLKKNTKYCGYPPKK